MPGGSVTRSRSASSRPRPGTSRAVEKAMNKRARLAAAPPRRRDPLARSCLVAARAAGTLAPARARRRASAQGSVWRWTRRGAARRAELGGPGDHRRAGRRRVRRLHAGDDPLCPERGRRDRRLHPRLAAQGSDPRPAGFWRLSRPRAASCSIFVLLFFGFVIAGWFVIRAVLPTDPAADRQAARRDRRRHLRAGLRGARAQLPARSCSTASSAAAASPAVGGWRPTTRRWTTR